MLLHKQEAARLFHQLLFSVHGLQLHRYTDSTLGRSEDLPNLLLFWFQAAAVVEVSPRAGADNTCIFEERTYGSGLGIPCREYLDQIADVCLEYM